jgi:hypothetical protein
VLTRRLPALLVDVEFDPRERVSFQGHDSFGGARKSTVFFGIEAEICGPPNVSFQQLVDSRDIAKSVLDASSKRINVKFNIFPLDQARPITITLDLGDFLRMDAKALRMNTLVAKA